MVLTAFSPDGNKLFRQFPFTVQRCKPLPSLLFYLIVPAIDLNNQ